jgi:DNA modification methylase
LLCREGQCRAEIEFLAPFDLIVWAKSNGVMLNPVMGNRVMRNLYRSQHELLALFKKGQAPHINNVQRGKKRRWRSNVWTYSGARLHSEARDGPSQHPTVKPVAMLQDALLDMAEPGDSVIDPFLGAGSTLIACEKTGRRCRGIELDPGYVEVILRRYEAVTGQAGVLESTNETYAELAARRQFEAGYRAASRADSD